MRKDMNGSFLRNLLIGSTVCLAMMWSAAGAADARPDLVKRYADMQAKLRTELSAKLPQVDEGRQQALVAAIKAGKKEGVDPLKKQLGLDAFLAGDTLDAKLVKFVVLHTATPDGLAAFAARGKREESLVEKLLADTDLMKQMLIADGASDGKYGRAMQIYDDIQQANPKAADGILQRLALAISLEHAVPRAQRSAEALPDAPKHVNPVKRYESYEKAFLGGELDPAFKDLAVWDLRFVVDGEEPDEIAAWGREMLRNYRPDHIYTSNYGWRYVATVGTEVRYGSGDVKYDRPELQFFQNILMNGGVCGRRAFFGRFILRSFGIPTTARPSRGHAALVHWTPRGWVINLGPRWGSGWTKTVYKADTDFLATTQARANQELFLQVKRAYWAGDVAGQKRTYGEAEDGDPAFWSRLALYTQRRIIEESKSETLAALGEELGESNKQPTIAEQVVATEVQPEDKEIKVDAEGVMHIPAAAYTQVASKKEVLSMKSFDGGLQIFLPRFSREGLTILRGGAWRGGAASCKSGARLPSAGYGRYNNWGFRAAMTAGDGQTPPEVTVDLGDGVTMEFVYIKPGTFIMGGENTKQSKWACVEVPKHEVKITKGYYLGKYEVTQAQFQKIMGRNPSKAAKDPNCPADNISEQDAVEFCEKVSGKTGREVRLPYEAEWEHACRAGSTTDYFFGDDPAKLGDYAWYKDNDGGKSHPVGQKKPNPWGLYDIYGNVCERVADTYAKDYYAKSPKEDPTGPKQANKSKVEYEVEVPQAGRYALAARVVTANAEQSLTLRANGDHEPIAMELPFTCGTWQDSKPVTVTLKKGKNVLRFCRDNPPQYGVAVKSFTLRPVQ